MGAIAWLVDCERTRRLRTALVAGAMLLAGCTMCPDPYDYSGPVPNGSTPQNNFRARSNGILPIGAAPLPWPPIVKGGGPAGADAGTIASRRDTKGGRAGMPTLADPAVEQAGGSEDATSIEPVSVLVDEAVDAQADEPAEAASPTVTPVVGDAIEGDVEPAAAVVAEEPVAVAATPDPPATPAIVVPVVLPSLAETPGWRRRRDR